LETVPPAALDWTEGLKLLLPLMVLGLLVGHSELFPC
jgi:hypothetical protein